MNKRELFFTTAAAMVLMAAFISCSKDDKDDKDNKNEPVPVITISTQSAASTDVMVGSISGSLTVAASVTEGATLTYQWYNNTSNSNTGGTGISGATAATFAIPATLTAGTYYYFCEVRATGATAVRSTAATVVVAPPADPGTANNPFIIKTPAELDAMRDNLSAYYKLGNDIDLTDYLASGAGFAKWGEAGWEPVGNSSGKFTGGLDGAGYKITDLWMDRTTGYDFGLFGYIEKAIIKNLGIEIAAAGINCTGKVGGVAGWADYGKISNCYVTGNISGKDNVGGVIGYGWGSVDKCILTSCYATGTISGEKYVGGVVGELAGSMTYCYATGDVIGTDMNVGGVAGAFGNDNMTYCYATGAVSGDDRVGGVVGTFGGDKMRYCVALNPSVHAKTDTYGCGRVSGTNPANSFTNNWARMDMEVKVGGANKTQFNKTGNDGADCAATPATSWWTTDAPNGPGWSNAGWTFADGQLPELK